MAGYNRIIMVGNLTRDPDYKQLASGQAVCQLGIAANRQYKNKQTGSMVQEVCFIDADVYGPQAESCRQYLQKGRSVLIEGRLKFDNWEAPDGQKRSKHSIVADRVVFLASAQGGEMDRMSGQDDTFKPAGQSSEKSAAAFQHQSKELKEDEISSGGEIDFKDEPPFQDDLPF